MMGPRPWSYEKNGEAADDGFIVVDANLQDVCLVENEDNAKIICHAVNTSTWEP